MIRAEASGRRRLAGAIVAWLALAARQVEAEAPWQAPPSARARRNPLPRSAGAAGARLYARHCAACHGAGGRGDGIAAAALNPRPRDLASSRVQREPDGALFWKLTTGRGAMPAWPWLTERERWTLVWAIRDLGRAAAR